jgi:hypothetical protein
VLEKRMWRAFPQNARNQHIGVEDCPQDT